MMELTLTPEEAELLLSIVEHRHREILKELWHTHHGEFKAHLRMKEKLLESILNRLEQAAVHPAA
jgi:hypothetical protein